MANPIDLTKITQNDSLSGSGRAHSLSGRKINPCNYGKARIKMSALAESPNSPVEGCLCMCWIWVVAQDEN
jgi:hypothetical protein